MNLPRMSMPKRPESLWGKSRSIREPGGSFPPGSEAPPGDFTPQPGATPLARMVAAQTLLETRLLARNGEVLLLTVVIPTLLLVLFGTVPLVDYGPAGRMGFVAPGVIALAVTATAFTGQAIATGFERRYGVLKRLAATPLPRAGLIAAKTATVGLVEAAQITLLVAVALGLGWAPRGSAPAVLALLAAGTAAFSGLGLLLAGTLRAEATLAVANLVFVLLLIGGGVVVPTDRFPTGLRPVLEKLPLTALSDGLRAVLTHGAALPLGPLAVLVGWAVVGLGAAVATFRWE